MQPRSKLDGQDGRERRENACVTLDPTGHRVRASTSVIVENIVARVQSNAISAAETRFPSGHRKSTS